MAKKLEQFSTNVSKNVDENNLYLNSTKTKNQMETIKKEMKNVTKKFTNIGKIVSTQKKSVLVNFNDNDLANNFNKLENRANKRAETTKKIYNNLHKAYESELAQNIVPGIKQIDDAMDTKKIDAADGSENGGHWYDGLIDD